MSRIQIEFLFKDETAAQAAIRVERASALIGQFGGTIEEGSSTVDERDLQRLTFLAHFPQAVHRIREDMLENLVTPEPRGCQATRVVDVTPIPPTIG
jgi:hypothetical protein